MLGLLGMEERVLDLLGMEERVRTLFLIVLRIVKMDFSG